MDRIATFKKLDAVIGRLFIRCLPRPRAALFHNASKILIVRPGGIGDSVHLVPAIQILQCHFSGVAIDLLAERRNAGAFALCPGIRRVYLYDHPGQLLRVLGNHYDVVIDSEQWHRLSAVVSRLVRSPVKIGYTTNERARLFTHVVPYRHDDYEVASFLHLLEPLGLAGSATPDDAWLRVPVAARKIVNSTLADVSNRPFIALFPGASIAERRWGAENFRAVAQWCGERGLGVVVVGGGGEREEAARIAGGLEHVFDFAGRTSLTETAAILERAAVVVSGDSGILHIAVGLGRPTVSLFGPGIATKWAPRGSQHVVLNKCLPCSPCTRFGYTPPCPHDNRCMCEITVDDVTRAIDVLLHES